MGAAFRITTTINPTKTTKKRKSTAKTAKSKSKTRKTSAKSKSKATTAPAKKGAKAKAKAESDKPKKKPGPPRRMTTGDHDWQIVFSRDGGQIAVRGPYVTKRAALADAKVVVRARIPEDIALIKETDVYGKETGYSGEDGSFSAEVIPSTGEITNTDDWRRYNPRHRNPEISVGSRVRVPQEHNYTGTVVRVGRPFEGAMLSYLVRFGSGREIWFTPEEVIHVNPRRSFGRMR